MLTENFLHGTVFLIVFNMHITLRRLLSGRVSLGRVRLSHVALGVVALRGRVAIHTLTSVCVCAGVCMCVCVCNYLL